MAIHRAAPPSRAEPYCAWYGDRAGDVLYFGVAAFWPTYRASGGDPRADLARPGPVPIGRFDLRSERLLGFLQVGAPGSRSGTWDVLAHPNGRIYFTTLYEAAGYADPATGAVRRFDAVGPGLNELALGPHGSILATRYAAAADGGGGVVALDPEGRLLAEHALTGPGGLAPAAKSVAWDPTRDEIWVTTDLLPEAGGATRHDARVLGPDGVERLRIERPEVQFVVFGPDATGYLAEVEGHSLALRVLPATGERPPGSRLLLDDRFDPELDFVQEIRVAPDGRVVVTRWSGRVHVVERSGEVRALELPRAGQGLYYTAVLRGERLCATLCDEVAVVCVDLPEAAAHRPAPALR